MAATRTEVQEDQSHWLGRFFSLVALALAGGLLFAACAAPEAQPTPTPAPVDPAGPVAPADPGDPADPAAPPDEPAPVDTTGVSFEGKTITFVVTFAPGGGYDVFSRITAQVIPRYLPGNPRVVVQNLAGGGGLRGLQYAMRSAPDGLTVLIPHTRWMMRDMLGTEVPDFTNDSAVWLGALGGIPTTSAAYIHRDVATSWEEAVAHAEQRGSPLRSGATEPGASGSRGEAFLEFIGEPVTILLGYGGTSEIAAAWDRREIDLTSRGSPEVAPRLFPEWIERKLPYPLFFWSTPPEDDAQFMEWMEIIDTPVPPHLFEIVDTEEWQRNTFSLVLRLGNATSRPVALPPGVPDEIAAVWREAIRQVSQDPQFQELGAAAGYDTGFTDPDEMMDIFIAGRANLGDPQVFDLFQHLVGDPG